MKDELTHIDASGKARMVGVTDKPDTRRVAVAEGKIYMERATLDRIEAVEIAKGDVLAVARIAGICAAKRTAELIPLCHTILLTDVDVDFSSFTEEEVEAQLPQQKLGLRSKTSQYQTPVPLPLYPAPVGDVSLHTRNGMRDSRTTPARVEVPARMACEPSDIFAIGIHNVNVLRSASPGDKDNAPTVNGP